MGFRGFAEGSFHAGSCAATPVHRSSLAPWPRLLGLEELTAALAAAALTKSGSVRDSGSGWREVSCSIPMARRGRGEPCDSSCPGLGGCSYGVLWGRTGLGGAAGGVGADAPGIAGRRNAQQAAGLCSASTQKVCTVHTLPFVCPIIKAR